MTLIAVLSHCFQPSIPTDNAMPPDHSHHLRKSSYFGGIGQGVAIACWAGSILVTIHTGAVAHDHPTTTDHGLVNYLLEQTLPSPAHLSHLSFEKADLRGVSLSGTNLVGANFQDADLSFSLLSAARLNYANLTNAVLEGATVDGATFEQATIVGADFTNVVFAEKTRQQLCLQATGKNPKTGRLTRVTLAC